MAPLYFVTTNAQKFAKATSACTPYGIELIQKKLDIDEVQSEDTEYVARRKAEAAFAVAHRPIIISDDAWCIRALGGFPGTYTKSVNEWFTPDDYLRLMAGIADRRISFVQTLVYQDEHGQQYFTRATAGTVLQAACGDSGVSIQAIVSVEKDTNKSIAEMIGEGSHYDGELASRVWHDFATWYTKRAKL